MMHIRIPTSDLREAVAALEKAVDRRGVIPILANALVTAEGDHVAFTGTDMELELRAEICRKPEKKGETTLPFEMLAKICRVARGEEIEIKADGVGWFKVESAGARFKLPILPASDFPKRPELEGEPCRFEIGCADLRRLLGRTAFAASTEVTRYYLCGVHLAPVADVLRAEATNGHMLARADTGLPEAAAGLPALIIPTRTVQAVLAALKGRADQAEVATDGRRLIVKVGDATIDSRLIEGNWPETDRVLPAGNEKIVRLNVAALREAVAIAATVNDVVALEIAENGAIECCGKDGNRGEASAQIADALCQHGPFQIGFSAKYLLAMTAGLAGEEVTFEMQDPGGPVVVRDGGDQRWLGVVMPMRI